MRISDWSSDVCSSDLIARAAGAHRQSLERAAFDLRANGVFGKPREAKTHLRGGDRCRLVRHRPTVLGTEPAAEVANADVRRIGDQQLAVRAKNPVRQLPAKLLPRAHEMRAGDLEP